MSPYNSGRMKPALVLGAIIFVIAFVMLFWLGDYGFIAALFLAILLALLTTIVIYLAFGWGEAPGYGAGATTAPAGAKPASAASTTPANTASDDAEAKAAKAKAEAEEAESRKAAEAEAAKKAAEDDAAKKAAQAEADQRAAEEDAARKAAEAEAKAKEEAEAAQASTAASTDAAADLGEDYDGDGVREGTGEGTRPAGLDSPRGGAADDLKMIKGVGPAMEKLCNSMGFWHFNQVASWSADEVAWVDANLKGFKGRVSRDKWVEQAKTLAAGGETEFSKRVEDGEVY